MSSPPAHAVPFRLWPPVAVGLPLACGWAGTALWGDPVELGAWSTALGWALVIAFAAWNGWALLLFRRHRTGLLPGQPTRTMIDSGPYRVSRNPLYLGLLALHAGLALLIPTLWGLLTVPIAAALLHWGAIIPEERFLRETFGAPYEDYARRVPRWW